MDERYDEVDAFGGGLVLSDDGVAGERPGHHDVRRGWRRGGRWDGRGPRARRQVSQPATIADLPFPVDRVLRNEHRVLRADAWVLTNDVATYDAARGAAR